MTRQQRWQLKQKANGRCRVCGEKLAGSKQHCPRHLAADNARQKAKYKKKREAHAASQ